MVSPCIAAWEVWIRIPFPPRLPLSDSCAKRKPQDLQGRNPSRAPRMSRALGVAAVCPAGVQAEQRSSRTACLPIASSKWGTGSRTPQFPSYPIHANNKGLGKLLGSTSCLSQRPSELHTKTPSFFLVSSMSSSYLQQGSRSGAWGCDLCKKLLLQRAVKRDDPVAEQVDWAEKIKAHF